MHPHGCQTGCWASEVGQANVGLRTPTAAEVVALAGTSACDLSGGSCPAACYRHVHRFLEHSFVSYADGVRQLLRHPSVASLSISADVVRGVERWV